MAGDTNTADTSREDLVTFGDEHKTAEIANEDEASEAGDDENAHEGEAIVIPGKTVASVYAQYVMCIM